MNKITNYDIPFDITDTVHCSDIVHITLNHSYFNIYNPKIDTPLQKFLFLFNNVKILSHSDNIYRLVLANNDNAKFIQFINVIDLKIHSIVTELYSRNFVPYSSYTNKKYSPPIFNVDFSTATIFDNNNKKLNSKLKHYSDITISCLIELHSIYIEKSSYTIKYCARQIKITNTCLDDNIFISDMNHLPISPPISLPIPIPPPISLPIQKHNIKSTIEASPQNIPVRHFTISPDDINKIKEKMRERKEAKEKEQQKCATELVIVTEDNKHKKIKKQSKMPITHIDMDKQVKLMMSELSTRKYKDKKIDEEFNKIINSKS